MLPSGRVLPPQPSHLPPPLPPKDFPNTLTALPPTFHGPACPGDQLRVSVWANGGGLGNVDLVLALQNESPRPCQLVGWPTVDGVTAAGAPTPFPHEPNLALGVNVTGVPVQTLTPGAMVVFEISGSDLLPNGASRCPPPYVTLRVTAPATKVRHTISAWVSWLGGDLPSCSMPRVSMVLPWPAIGAGHVIN